MKSDYKTGYGNPPKETQFKPGKSGNPNGRPKGAKNVSTVLKKEINELVLVTKGNKQEKVIVLEALVKSALAHALSGKVGALNLIFKLIAQLETSDENINISLFQEDGSVKHKEVDIKKILDGLGH